MCTIFHLFSFLLLHLLKKFPRACLSVTKKGDFFAAPSSLSHRFCCSFLSQRPRKRPSKAWNQKIAQRPIHRSFT